MEYVRNDVHVLERVVDAIRELYNISINGKIVPFVTCFSRSMAAGHLWNKMHDEKTREMLVQLPHGPCAKIRSGMKKFRW